jgi:hypothetical protein
MSTNFNDLSFKVASTLTANRGVFLSAAETVGYPTATTSQPIGVTTDNVLDTTMAIPVKTLGITPLLFNDTVAAGALVALDSSGRGVPAVGLTTTYSFVLGRLIGAKVDATGTVANVLVNPFSVYGLL